MAAPAGAEIPKTATHSPAHTPIDIQVGERTFRTTRYTLAESPRLTNLTRLAAPYFVDADPAHFEHILRYLRTSRYPLLFDADRGHDELLYAELRHAARFYGLVRLIRWIGEKRYLRAVTTHIRPGQRKLYGAQIPRSAELIEPGGHRIVPLRVEKKRKTAHRCPAGKMVHYGDRDSCRADNCYLGGWYTGVDNEMMDVVKMDYVGLEIEVGDVDAAVGPHQGLAEHHVLPAYDEIGNLAGGVAVIAGNAAAGADRNAGNAGNAGIAGDAENTGNAGNAGDAGSAENAEERAQPVAAM